MRQVGFFEAIARANSHFRYWKCRRDLGRPVSIWMTAGQWLRRLAYEWLGIGHGA